MEKQHGLSRDRQPKFTNDELAIILGEVSRHKDVMLSRSLDQETSKFKRQFWQDVAAKLNAVNGHSLRTANEMHFKWRDWKSRTMRKVAHYQRAISEGKMIDDKSNLSDIEQRLVLLLAGTNDDDESDNANSEDDSKLLSHGDADDTELDAEGDSGAIPDADANNINVDVDAPTAAALSRAVAVARSFSSAFESFRSCAALPTQVNARVSQSRTADDHQHHESVSSCKRPRTESTACNGDTKPASVGVVVNGNAGASAGVTTPTDHMADAILRQAGDHSVLLFTLLSTQLKQVQDLAESQREQLKVLQDVARRHEKHESSAGVNSLCNKCTRFSEDNSRSSHGTPIVERPRLQIDHLAPEFNGLAVVNEAIQPFQLSDLHGRFALILFYPHDFTAESRQFIMAFNARVQQFEAAACRLVACSTDSQHAHLAWVRMRKENGGLGRTDFALVADNAGLIARRYNVYNYHDGSAHYAMVIIDEKGFVKQFTVTQTWHVDVDGIFKVVKSFQ